MKSQKAFRVAGGALVFCASFVFAWYFTFESGTQDTGQETATQARVESEGQADFASEGNWADIAANARSCWDLRAINWEMDPQTGLSTKEFCTDVNVVKGKPYAQKIRDQKVTGWCYAFATADAMSLQLRRRVSAVGVASAKITRWRQLLGVAERFYPKKASEDRPNDFEERGAFSYSGPLAFVASYGYCDENELNDEALMNLFAKLAQDPKYADVLEQVRIIPKGDYRTADEKKRDPVSFHDAEKQMHELLLASGFTEQQVDRLRALANNPTNRPLANLVTSLCGTWRQRKKFLPSLRFSAAWPYFPVSCTIPQPKDYGRSPKQRYLTEAHRALWGGYPFLMSHDVGKIRAGGDTEAIHASIVVGRRWNDDKAHGGKNPRCEFLVKNSWGANNGAGYLRDKVTPIVNASQNPSNDPGTNYSGYYWLPEASFLEVMKWKEAGDAEATDHGKVYWFWYPKAQNE